MEWISNNGQQSTLFFPPSVSPQVDVPRPDILVGCKGSAAASSIATLAEAAVEQVGRGGNLRIPTRTRTCLD